MRYENLLRHEHWRARLEAAIDEIMYVPFEWGQHDCGPGFVGRIFSAVTGQNIPEFERFRGKYHDAESAAACLRDLGFADMGEACAEHLPEIHPSMAKIGDIVAFAIPKSPVGYALGVVNGERCFFLRQEGLGTVDLLACSRAFKVG